jgi:hypothetical protein
LQSCYLLLFHCCCLLHLVSSQSYMPQHSNRDTATSWLPARHAGAHCAAGLVTCFQSTAAAAAAAACLLRLQHMPGSLFLHNVFQRAVINLAAGLIAADVCCTLCKLA